MEKRASEGNLGVVTLARMWPGRNSAKPVSPRVPWVLGSPARICLPYGCVLLPGNFMFSLWNARPPPPFFDQHDL